MLTESLQRLFDIVKDLPPEEQDRVAAVVRALLEQPDVNSDVVRPEVMQSFVEVVSHSTDVLTYLRDK